MFNQIHQVDSYLIWQKPSLKAADHSALVTMIDSGAKGGKFQGAGLPS